MIELTKREKAAIEQRMKARNRRDLKVITSLLLILVGLAAFITDWS